jgi:hypothetical protein
VLCRGHGSKVQLANHGLALKVPGQQGVGHTPEKVFACVVTCHASLPKGGVEIHSIAHCCINWTRHIRETGVAPLRDQTMTTANKIELEISALPPHLQAEVLDFVQFVKQRHGIARVPVDDGNLQSGGDSLFFQALSEAGFVGCIETDEQLSTSYKQHIDFSAKVGLQT